MATEIRRSPYVWTTWIARLLAGDKHCEWAAWFKTHHLYDKRPPTNPNALTKWKSDHALAVRARVETLTDDGWSVTVEDQNRFNYKGKLATVGGCPDIVAVKLGEVRIEDPKTGKERDSDFYQVATYGMLYPLVAAERLAGLRLSAALIYGGAAVDGPRRSIVLGDALEAVEADAVTATRVRAVSSAEIDAARPRIVGMVRRLAGAAELRRVPSPSECAYCDILVCPDRAVGGVAEVEGDLF